MNKWNMTESVMRSNTLLALAVAALLLTSCSETITVFEVGPGATKAPVVYKAEGIGKFKRNPDGSSIRADTPGNWLEFRLIVDRRVEREAQGARGEGGISWNEGWEHQITAIKKSQENPDRYITYILEQRRKAGLPELSS